jgi:hypothetical protein
VASPCHSVQAAGHPAGFLVCSCAIGHRAFRVTAAGIGREALRYRLRKMGVAEQ